METDSVIQVVGSGGLFLAKDTQRFLFLMRTQKKSINTWGLVGGKKEPQDTTVIDCLHREIREEIGKTPTIRKIIPLELFTSNDQSFQFNTYVLIVDREFIPILNEEHSGYTWCSFNCWPKPLHQGVKNSISNRTTKAKLNILLELL
jgi:8-oxo-dGTP pyrophosphatase MutT (NUDIX family)